MQQTFMNMSIHVILGPDPPLHGVQQVHTSRPHTRATEVTKPQWRTVGDQDVGVGGDLVPLLKTLFSSL